MAIHDMWHFENAPQGVNLSVAAYQTTYNGNTIYNQYTGNPGQPLSYGAGNTFPISSDGFLTITSNSSGQQGGLVVPCGQVQDWSVATQYWVGFRTKLSVANASTTPLLFGLTANTSWGSFLTMLNESMMIAAGLSATGTEYYVEVFLDRVALTFQVYVGGLLINSGAITGGVFTAANYLWWGGIAAGTANYARGYRDFYFLDVDSKYPSRLGPIRAKAATLTAAAGSDWTPNGASTSLAALQTALTSGSPSMTPNTQSPTDKQPLVLSLSTTVTDSGNKIIGVQPSLSFQPANGTPVTLAAGFQDASNPLVNSGSFTAAATAPLYNQKLPVVLTQPNGQPWTAAEINQAQYVLTPQ